MALSLEMDSSFVWSFSPAPVVWYDCSYWLRHILVSSMVFKRLSNLRRFFPHIVYRSRLTAYVVYFGKNDWLAPLPLHKGVPDLSPVWDRFLHPAPTEFLIITARNRNVCVTLLPAPAVCMTTPTHIRKTQRISAHTIMEMHWFCLLPPCRRKRVIL